MSKSKILFLTVLGVFAMSACSPIGGNSGEGPGSDSSDPTPVNPSSSSDHPVMKPIYFHYPASEATCTRFGNYECWIKESNGIVVVGSAPSNANIIEADPASLEDNEFKEYYKEAAAGHSWSTWTDKEGEEATCWHAGKEIRHCFTCLLEEERGKQVNHSYQDEITEPTCTEGGYTTHTCTECSDVTIDTYTPAAGHQLTPVANQAATCTTDGHVAHYHCAVCHKNYEDSEATIEISDVVLPLLGHSWTNKTYDWNDDYTIVTAHAVCAHDPNHVLNDQAVRISESTEGNVTTYVSGEFSQSSIFEAQTIKVNTDPGHIHTYDSGEVTAPTCGHDGYTTYTCTDPDCEYSYVEVDAGSALSHTMAHHPKVDQTCTDDGNIEYYQCTTFGGCGLKYTDAAGENPVSDVVLPHYEHNYVPQVIQPTCTDKGYTTYVCTRCGNHYEESYVPATGHTWSDWVVDPDNPVTCTEDGKEIRTCSVCGTVERRDATHYGHDIVFDHFEWANQNTTAKAVYICSHGCGETEKYDAEMSFEPNVSPTCSDTGSGTYTATYEDHSQTKGGIVPIDPDAHNYQSTGTYSWNSTKTELKENLACVHNPEHTSQETIYTKASTPLFENSNARTKLASNMAANYRDGGKYGDVDLFYKYKDNVTAAEKEFDFDMTLRLTRSTPIASMKDLLIIRADDSYEYGGSIGSKGNYGLFYTDLTTENDSKYVATATDNKKQYTSAVVDDFETDFRNFTKDVVILVHGHLDNTDKTITVTFRYFTRVDDYEGYLGYTQTFVTNFSNTDTITVTSIKITRPKESGDTVSTNMVIEDIVNNNGVFDYDIVTSVFTGTWMWQDQFEEVVIKDVA